MVKGLANVSHLVVMDNFFSSIELFMNLLSMGICVMGMVRQNRVGLPMDLKDTKSFKNLNQGFTQWQMHDNQQI